MTLKATPVRFDARLTREAIRKYFTDNPFANQQDCTQDLGIGHMAVSRHFRALRAEWQEQRAQAKQEAQDKK